MTDTSQAVDVRNYPPAKNDKPKRLQIRRKLQVACDRLVYDGLPFDQAARSVGFSVQAMRKALGRPHVIAYLREQREILRASMCGANILALADVRDQVENQNARVAAVKVMEQIGETENNRYGSGRSAAVTMPGLVIQIIQQPASLTGQQREIEANPLIALKADTLTESVDR